MSVLFRLSVLCPCDFKKEQGAEVLLQFIKNGTDTDQVECALRVLRHLAQQCQSTRTWLGQHGAIDVATSRFLDKEMSGNMRNEAVMALHALCTNCEPNVTKFENADITRVCVSALRDLCGSDSTLPNVLIIQTVAMLWTVLLQSEQCLECLLAQDGMYGAMQAGFWQCSIRGWSR